MIDTVVSYVCDPIAGTLRRYADYGLESMQALPPAASGALVGSNVSDCEFEYQTGGLLKMRLAL